MSVYKNIIEYLDNNPIALYRVVSNKLLIRGNLGGLKSILNQSLFSSLKLNIHITGDCYVNKIPRNIKHSDFLYSKENDISYFNYNLEVDKLILDNIDIHCDNSSLGYKNAFTGLRDLIVKDNFSANKAIFKDLNLILHRCFIKSSKFKNTCIECTNTTNYLNTIGGTFKNCIVKNFPYIVINAVDSDLESTSCDYITLYVYSGTTNRFKIRKTKRLTLAYKDTFESSVLDVECDTLSVPYRDIEEFCSYVNLDKFLNLRFRFLKFSNSKTVSYKTVLETLSNN